MKKSKMIKILEDSICKHIDFDNGFTGNEAELILADLQSAGMLPPFYLFDHLNPDINKRKPKLEWEPEND